MVCKAVGKLTAHKLDSNDKISTNNFIYGCPLLFWHTAALLNKVLISGQVPQELGISTVKPIPKDKRKSINQSDNYRSIASNSILQKKILIS